MFTQFIAFKNLSCGQFVLDKTFEHSYKKNNNRMLLFTMNTETKHKEIVAFGDFFYDTFVFFLSWKEEEASNPSCQLQFYLSLLFLSSPSYCKPYFFTQHLLYPLIESKQMLPNKSTVGHKAK